MIQLNRINAFYLILIVISMSLGCSSTSRQVKRFGVERSLVKLVIQSRRKELDRMRQKERITEYKVMKRHQTYSLLYLFDLYSGALKGSDRINIIENYEGENKLYSGVIWVRDTLFKYNYDINSKMHYRLDTIYNMAEYPRNPDIHEDLIEFYTSFSWDKGFDNFPANGRTNNGYYVYTQILIAAGGQWKVRSIAMQQF